VTTRCRVVVEIVKLLHQLRIELNRCRDAKHD
jgi:hypothetical protein